MRRAVRLCLRISIILALGGCGPSAQTPQQREPKTILAADWLAKFPESKPEELATLSNSIEILLIENHFLFRIPTRKVDQPLVDAAKRFQAEHGFPVTGGISMEEADLLSKGLGNIDGDIDLPPDTTFAVFDPVPGNRVAVLSRATWVMTEPAEEKLAEPLNTSEIRCEESLRRCIESKASILKIGAASAPMLNLDVTLWDITAWSTSTVTAEIGGTCAIQRLEINWSEKSARILVIRNPQGDLSCSDSLKDQGVGQVLELRDPFTVSWAYRQQAKEERRSVWSKDYRAALDAAEPGTSTNEATPARPAPIGNQ